jgi:hypothetical protein
MRWPEVHAAPPDHGLVIEARTVGNRRIFDRIAVIDTCPDGRTTMKRYGELHRQHPEREFCFVHTTKVELDIEERRWIGARSIPTEYLDKFSPEALCSFCYPSYVVMNET